MTDKKLTHADAELSLRLYDLRREEIMRKSRDAVNADFWPESADDLMNIYSWEHPLNAAIRQTGSYWEMVYGMARNGIIDPDFLIESHGEGLVLFAKIEPFLGELRKLFGDQAFQNAEWITQNSEQGRVALERIRGRLKMFREMMTKKQEQKA